MTATQISDISVNTIDGETRVYRKSEWLIGDASDLADIPTVAPGSVAYTADMTLMYMYDGENWTKIGGGS